MDLRICGGDWSLQGELRGEGREFFGDALSINAVGNVLVVGGRDGNVARLYHYENGSWSQKGGDITGDQYFGFSVSLDETGMILAASDFNGNDVNGVKTGYAQVFEW